MPKGRYAIMLRHMPRVGSMGLDMMLRTCTIQVNLDYASEADMVKKFRVGLALQPLATALVRQFAVHRGQAQRHAVVPQPYLVGHRSARAPACCRSCSRTGSATSATPITRSMCRCTSSTATASISTPPGFSFRDFLEGRAVGPARREADDRRLDRPPLDRLPRSAAQDLPRDARRRRRAVEPDLRAAGVVGRAALRPGRARCGVGSGQGLVDRRAPGACATRCPKLALDAPIARRRQAARHRRRGARHRACRA